MSQVTGVYVCACFFIIDYRNTSCNCLKEHDQIWKGEGGGHVEYTIFDHALLQILYLQIVGPL